MQNPFDKYKQAITKKGNNSQPPVKGQTKKASAKISPMVRKQKLERVKKSNTLPLGWIALSFIGLVLSFYIFNYTDNFLSLLSRVQVQFLSANAADGEKSASPGTQKEVNNSITAKEKEGGTLSGDDSLTMEKANVYKALRDKEKKLEVKEQELAQLEKDLHIQKEEIEKQLGELVEMRRTISSKIETKVIADQESVEKLVGVYATMKPQNAALVIAQINDDLAIKVLSKMKKQSAAAILNYLEPEKAQLLSEKYAGLKK